MSFSCHALCMYATLQSRSNKCLNVIIYLTRMANSQGAYFRRLFIWHNTKYTLLYCVYRGKYKRTLTLISNAFVQMLYVMKMRLNFKSELNMRGNILHENIKVMNTGYLTVILSVDRNISGSLSVFCQKLHKRCQYLCY